MTKTINTLDDIGKDEFSYKLDFDYSNISNKDLLPINKSLEGSTAATAANYGVIHIVNKAVEVVYVAVSWETASTSGTLNLERLSGTEALDAGDEIFVDDIDLSLTADTVNTKEGKDLQNTILKPGDRLALKDGGTLTNQAGLCVSIYLKPVAKGHYN